MKKFLIVLAFAGFSAASMAQEADAMEKYSVSTNSFWSNWFVQGGVQWDAFYPSLKDGVHTSDNPFKGYRSNPQIAVAIGKWFTPGLGLRTKISGLWGKANDDGFHYWNAQEHILFNLSNMICGYNPERIYSFIPFVGGGIARNCSDNQYAMGLSVGLLNQFRVSRKVAVNFELGWNRFETDFMSKSNSIGSGAWESHDNILYAEVGVTVNLGKGTWNRTPDVDAIKALSQSQIDALKAQLNDANSENDRLKNMLANQPKPEPVTEAIKEFITTPVSVFFNFDKTEIAELKDLVNVRALAKYAVENNSNILVTGYADSATGKAAHNQTLSEKRAKRVADELVKMGVSESKIKQEAKGGVEDLSPISYNRRATVQIVE